MLISPVLDQKCAQNTNMVQTYLDKQYRYLLEYHMSLNTLAGEVLRGTGIFKKSRVTQTYEYPMVFPLTAL